MRGVKCKEKKNTASVTKIILSSCCLQLVNYFLSLSLSCFRFYELKIYTQTVSNYISKKKKSLTI